MACLQETPVSIREIGQSWEYSCSSAGEITVPERVGINNALKTFFFPSGFCPCVGFFTIGSNHFCNPDLRSSTFDLHGPVAKKQRLYDSS